MLPVYCFAVALGLAGLVVTVVFPDYAVTDAGAVPRYWPDSFLGFAFSAGIAPLAAYERVPAIRERWGQRPHRESPPMA